MEVLFLNPSLDKSPGLALKASSSKRVEVSDSDSDDDKPSYNFLEKFQEFLKEELMSRDCKRKEEPVPMCFGCGELGHINPYCPNRKEKKKKERAYMAWDSESSSDETAALCLMAHEQNGERSNPENSTQHLSSSGLDGTEAVGTIAAHFSNENQTEERRNNIRRIKELCGNMQGIREIAGSSKRKKQ
ncbi:unnamed protein product [Cuscuta campestris]|uniref:CCHC-type domain-containing protein n=1 Tax=Cuscuta campestris TaxID=132261 RepID=A0A484N7X0_9ASTE|nr:unnamed protein product [Cuscuta campestris]